MLKNEKSANRNDHQNRKTEVFCNKNRKTDLKNRQNRKTENPNAPLRKEDRKKTNIKEIMRKERCKHYEITVSCNFMLTRATELPFVVFYKSVIVVS